MSKIKTWLRRMNRIPCIKCGSRKTKEVALDHINYIVCESEIVCAECGAHINYWAYGNLQEPETYTELWHRAKYHYMYKLKKLFKSRDIKTKRR